MPAACSRPGARRSADGPGCAAPRRTPLPRRAGRRGRLGRRGRALGDRSLDVTPQDPVAGAGAADLLHREAGLARHLPCQRAREHPPVRRRRRRRGCLVGRGGGGDGDRPGLWYGGPRARAGSGTSRRSGTTGAEASATPSSRRSASRSSTCSPGLPRTAIGAPTSTWAPGGTSVLSTTPSASASTSTIALSVSTVARASAAANSASSATSHSASTASVGVGRDTGHPQQGGIVSTSRSR